jgi:hypothetical protein
MLNVIGRLVSLFKILSIYINGPLESKYSILFICIDIFDEIYLSYISIWPELARSSLLSSI